MNFSLPKTQFKEKFSFSHRELLIGFCAVLVLIVRFIFPVTLTGELFWSSLALFFVFPFLIIRYFLKENLGNFGLSRGNVRSGVILSVVVIITFILLNYFVIRNPALRGQISVLPEMAGSFWAFLWFALVISASLHFSWEFFFRGFLQLGLEKRLGWFSLFAQAFLQSLIFIQGSWVMILLVFFSALSAGIIARQSRSVVYSFISMWIISISLDIMVVRFINQIIS